MSDRIQRRTVLKRTAALGTAGLVAGCGGKSGTATPRASIGTFNPVDVIKDLEGRTYQSGVGEETMRACDHQSIRPVPVARGLPPSKRKQGSYFKVTKLVSDVAYPCDGGPAKNCTLGPVK